MENSDHSHANAAENASRSFAGKTKQVLKPVSVSVASKKGFLYIFAPWNQLK